MRHRILALVPLLGAVTLPAVSAVPPGFETVQVLDNLVDPSTMAFAPDGRLFIAERIEGRLRVATRDAGTGQWVLSPQPFYTFDIPTDGNGNPERHRSSGLRGFAFDPGFADNGYVYCFYMKDAPRHNRVVRIQADPSNPAVALPGELLLMELPFNGTESSGSHNGGAVLVGGDDKLYFTTGDGWNGGDDVQSLSTFTGKAFRLELDGSIPEDNPFFDQASGELRATFALGLRNPFSMSRHPETGQVYVNDVAGSAKADLLALTAGANYGHDGYDGIGVSLSEWVSVGSGSSSGRVVSGGAWYPACGPFPAEYHGGYFATLWGGNGAPAGSISRVESAVDPTVHEFATGIGYATPRGALRPMYARVGPEGHLYYLASDYETGEGKVFEVRPIGSTSADTNANGVPDACEIAVLDLEMADRSSISWTALAYAAAYDLVRGDLELLRTTGDFGAAAQECLAGEIVGTQHSFAGTPDPGAGDWFLVRGLGAGGPLTYDSGSGAQEGSRDVITVCP